MVGSNRTAGSEAFSFGFSFVLTKTSGADWIQINRRLFLFVSRS